MIAVLLLLLLFVSEVRSACEDYFLCSDCTTLEAGCVYCAKNDGSGGACATKGAQLDANTCFFLGGTLIDQSVAPVAGPPTTTNVCPAESPCSVNHGQDCGLCDADATCGFCFLKGTTAGRCYGAGFASACQVTGTHLFMTDGCPTLAPTSAPTAAPTTVPTSAPTGAPTSAPTFAANTLCSTAAFDADCSSCVQHPDPMTGGAQMCKYCVGGASCHPAGTADATCTGMGGVFGPCPTSAPTTAPTAAPTTAPTTRPTTAPTMAPTTAPTMAPTTAPTPGATTQAATTTTGGGAGPTTTGGGGGGSTTTGDGGTTTGGGTTVGGGTTATGTTPAPAVDCAGALSCASCAALSACSWCEMNDGGGGFCGLTNELPLSVCGEPSTVLAAATKVGPANSTVAGVAQAHCDQELGAAAANRSTCAELHGRNCATCLADADCSFCVLPGGEGQCMNADGGAGALALCSKAWGQYATTVLNGTAACPQRLSNQAQVPARAQRATCARQNSCSDCEQEAGCGWCGVAIGGGACSASSLQFGLTCRSVTGTVREADQCAAADQAPDDTCQTNYDVALAGSLPNATCAGCIGQGDCGWCAPAGAAPGPGRCYGASGPFAWLAALCTNEGRWATSSASSDQCPSNALPNMATTTGADSDAQSASASAYHYQQGLSSEDPFQRFLNQEVAGIKMLYVLCAAAGLVCVIVTIGLIVCVKKRNSNKRRGHNSRNDGEFGWIGHRLLCNQSNRFGLLWSNRVKVTPTHVTGHGRALFSSSPSRAALKDVWPRFPEMWLGKEVAIPKTDLMDHGVMIEGVWPHHWYAGLLDVVHSSGMISWVACGWTAALLFRLAVLPFTFTAMEHQSIGQLLQPATAHIMGRMREARAAGDVEGAKRARLALDRLSDEHHGFLSWRAQVLPFVPFLLTVGFAVTSILSWRYLCAHFPSTMMDQNFLGVVELSRRAIDVDQWLLLPLSASALQLASITTSLVRAVRAPQPLRLGQKLLFAVSYVWTVLFSFVAPFFPQGVIACYWLPAACLTFSQTVIFSLLFSWLKLKPPGGRRFEASRAILEKRQQEAAKVRPPNRAQRRRQSKTNKTTSN